MFSIKLVFKQQIRRVQIGEDAGLKDFSYANLHGTAKKLFTLIGTQAFYFKYEDDEGDTITFSTDEELAEALRVMKSMDLSVFRFEVVLEQDVPAKAVHHYITCDGCGMSPIIGTRFKCKVLNDFDLCECCEAKKQHPHELRAIEQPVNFRMRCARLRQQQQRHQAAGGGGGGGAGGAGKGMRCGDGEGGCGPRGNRGGPCGGGRKQQQCPFSFRADASAATNAAAECPFPFAALAKDILEGIQKAVPAATDGGGTDAGAGAGRLGTDAPSIAGAVEATAKAFGFDSDSPQVKHWVGFAQDCAQAGLIDELLGEGAAASIFSLASADGDKKPKHEGSTDEKDTEVAAETEAAPAGSPTAGSFSVDVEAEIEIKVDSPPPAAPPAAAEDYVFADPGARTPPAADAFSISPSFSPSASAVAEESVAAAGGPLTRLEKWQKELQLLADMGFSDVEGLIPLLEKHVPAGSQQDEGRRAISEIGIQRVIQAYLSN